MTPETLLKVCSMPNAFTTSLNKSMVQLLKESGYLGHENEVTKDEIMEFLKTHPDFIESWKEYSEDKRCSSGWYLLHEDSIWTVGYFGVGGKAKEQRYTSGFVNADLKCPLFAGIKCPLIAGFTLRGSRVRGVPRPPLEKARTCLLSAFP